MPSQKRLKTVTLLNRGQSTSRVFLKVTCSPNSLKASLQSLLPLDWPIDPGLHGMSLLFIGEPLLWKNCAVSFQQLCLWLEVVEYTGKVCKLSEAGWASARLHTLHVLGTAILKSPILEASNAIGNISHQASSSNEVEFPTKAGIEWNDQNDEYLYGLERATTIIHN